MSRYPGGSGTPGGLSTQYLSSSTGHEQDDDSSPYRGTSQHGETDLVREIAKYKEALSCGKDTAPKLLDRIERLAKQTQDTFSGLLEDFELVERRKDELEHTNEDLCNQLQKSAEWTEGQLRTWRAKYDRAMQELDRTEIALADAEQRFSTGGNGGRTAEHFGRSNEDLSQQIESLKKQLKDANKQLAESNELWSSRLAAVEKELDENESEWRHSNAALTAEVREARQRAEQMNCERTERENEIKLLQAECRALNGSLEEKLGQLQGGMHTLRQVFCLIPHLREREDYFACSKMEIGNRLLDGLAMVAEELRYLVNSDEHTIVAEAEPTQHILIEELFEYTKRQKESLEQLIQNVTRNITENMERSLHEYSCRKSVEENEMLNQLYNRLSATISENSMKSGTEVMEGTKLELHQHQHEHNHNHTHYHQHLHQDDAIFIQDEQTSKKPAISSETEAVIDERRITVNLSGPASRTTARVKVAATAD